MPKARAITSGTALKSFHKYICEESPSFQEERESEAKRKRW
jgi:hypothetical protein